MFIQSRFLLSRKHIKNHERYTKGGRMLLKMGLRKSLSAFFYRNSQFDGGNCMCGNRILSKFAMADVKNSKLA